MKQALSLLVILACVVFFVVPGIAQNKYVGANACAPCHKSEKTGNQFGIWQKSAHAKAFETLSSEKAKTIAKAKGLKTAPAEAKECLQCHIIVVDAKQVAPSFKASDGVQCEVCHGPGSAYKSMGIMKDKAKAIAAGLTEYKDQAAIEAKCKTCHNDKSPTFKGFEFKKMWDQIKHPLKKS